MGTGSQYALFHTHNNQARIIRFYLHEEARRPFSLACSHLVSWLRRVFASASLASRSFLNRAVLDSCVRRSSCALLSVGPAPTGGLWIRLNISSACWRVL